MLGRSWKIQKDQERLRFKDPSPIHPRGKDPSYKGKPYKPCKAGELNKTLEEFERIKKQPGSVRGLSQRKACGESGDNGHMWPYRPYPNIRPCTYATSTDKKKHDGKMFCWRVRAAETWKNGTTVCQGLERVRSRRCEGHRRNHRQHVGRALVRDG